jgi:hypothetical protein
MLGVWSAVFYSLHVEQSHFVCRRADGSQEQKHNRLLLIDEDIFLSPQKFNK